jgi:hypothetical protein
MLLLGREGHLPAVITQNSNNGCEKDHHNKVNRVRDFSTGSPPEDQDDFEDEKENGKLDLSFHEMGEFQPVIDPPSEKTGGHGKRRGDGSQDEKVEARDLEGGILEEEVEKNKEGGGH